MRSILTWLGIGGAILAAYIAQKVFNLSGTEMVLAVVWIFVLVLSHEISTLKEERPKFKKSD